MKETIMQKPEDLERASDSYRLMKGSEVIARFYDQTIWKENYIPKVLNDKQWRPDREKLYRCYWKYVDPADPADPGYSILRFIEEY